MVDGGLLVVSNFVVNDTQVYMSQELSSDVSNLLVLHVILDGIAEMISIDLSQLHVVHSDAIVGQSFSMNVSDCSADLQELLVLPDSIFVFSKIVKEHSGTVVGSSFVSRLSSSFTSKS